MKNKVQLITYVNRLSGGGLAKLTQLLEGPLSNLFGAVHLLPFYHKIDGLDAGFDPVDHLIVDEKLGVWSEVAVLAKNIDIMADVIVNHMSCHSPQFQDYSENGANSPYASLFLTRDTVFKADTGTVQQRAEQALAIASIYRPRPTAVFTDITLKTGQTRAFWTTFTHEQIDINVEHPSGEQYLHDILTTLSHYGVTMARLDAVGYAIKRPGTTCFMIPQTYEFIERFSKQALSLGIECLVEIHTYYQTQIDIAKRVSWVYDFALPPLLLHAYYYKSNTHLYDWLTVRPNNCITVLDTHDGIGIIDIGPDKSDRINRPGLVPDAELDGLVELIHGACHNQSRLATGAAASNLDLYQINCTYLDALGGNTAPYLVARLVQFFMPGVPQVYYVGLLAGRNDMELLAKTQVGRDINRHYYSQTEVLNALTQPVVMQLCDLIRLRNEHAAFSGQFSTQLCDEKGVIMQWINGTHHATLCVNFEKQLAELSYSSGHGDTMKQPFNFNPAI
jgi:sucrose phosphorylase